jgi:hypothetical protein
VFVVAFEATLHSFYTLPRITCTYARGCSLVRVVPCGAAQIALWFFMGSCFTLQHRLRYSARNASTGSTLSARLAGCQAAKVARASSATAAAVNVIVSNGSTPCKRP